MQFDQLAAGNGENLIQLHHNDEPQWCQKLLEARKLRAHGVRVDLRTRSYGDIL